MAVDPLTARAEALRAAAALHARDYSKRWPCPDDMAVEAVLRTANRLTAWLLGPTRLRFTLGPTTDQPTNTVQAQPTEGSAMATLKDTQQVVVAVEAEDSKGFPVADTFTFTEDSDGAVLTLVPGDDGQFVTVKAGAPGSAVLTATDASGLTGTLAFDVTTGDIASIVMSAGSPTEQ